MLLLRRTASEKIALQAHVIVFGYGDRIAAECIFVRDWNDLDRSSIGMNIAAMDIEFGLNAVAFFAFQQAWTVPSRAYAQESGDGDESSVRASDNIVRIPSGWN